MNLQDILLLGNDMIIPRDIRDWGVYMGSEPQVEKNTLKLNPTKKKPHIRTQLSETSVCGS